MSAASAQNTPPNKSILSIDYFGVGLTQHRRRCVQLWRNRRVWAGAHKATWKSEHFVCAEGSLNQMAQCELSWRTASPIYRGRRRARAQRRRRRDADVLSASRVLTSTRGDDAAPLVNPDEQRGAQVETSERDAIT